MIEIINIKDGLNEYPPIQEKEHTKEYKKYLENFFILAYYGDISFEQYEKLPDEHIDWYLKKIKEHLFKKANALN